MKILNMAVPILQSRPKLERCNSSSNEKWLMTSNYFRQFFFFDEIQSNVALQNQVH